MMDKKFLHLLLISLLCTGIILTSVSCRHEPVFSDNIDSVCFEEQILPVLLNSCAVSGCHDAGTGSSGIIINGYESVMSLVKPCDARGSELYQAITDIWGDDMMPPDKPLSVEQRTLIHLWIAQGAKNTTCSQQPPDTNGNIPPPVRDTICFEQDILPVFISGCALQNCHNAASHVEGYNLTSYALITQDDESIVPFDPDESKLYKVITDDDPDDRMPPLPYPPLTSEQIQKLRQWIEQGALNSNCPESVCDTAGIISFSSVVWPVIQANCVGCHNTTLASGGVNLNGYSQVKATADILRNGTSVLYGSIKQLAGFSPMPQGSKLQDCNIGQIKLWIAQGKQNN